MFSTRNSVQRCLMGSRTLVRISQKSFAADLHSDRKMVHDEHTLTPELKDHLKKIGINNPNIVQNPT